MAGITERWLVKHNLVLGFVLFFVVAASFLPWASVRAVALFLLFSPLYWKTHFQDDLRGEG